MTTHNLYTVSNVTATNITPGLDRGFDITIQNVNNNGFIYVGGEGVTAEDYGFRILPNNAWSVEVPEIDDLYIIASDNNLKAAVLRLNLERN